jgi:hypothetical protein
VLSANPTCGFLITCSTLGPAWELLALFSWIGGFVKRRAAAARVSRGGVGGGIGGVAGDAAGVGGSDTAHAAAAAAAFNNPTPPPPAPSPGRGHTHVSGLGSGRTGTTTNPRPAVRPVFDLPGQHAFNVVVLACTLTYAALAPVLLVPGTLFFAVRYLVHKHNLLCLHRDALAGAGDGLFGGGGRADLNIGRTSVGGVDGVGAVGSTAAKKASDGRLLATVVHLMRVSAFIHAAVMAAFLNLRGTPAQCACANIILAVVLLRSQVGLDATFHFTLFCTVTKHGSIDNRRDSRYDPCTKPTLTPPGSECNLTRRWSGCSRGRAAEIPAAAAAAAAGVGEVGAVGGRAGGAATHCSAARASRGAAAAGAWTRLLRFCSTRRDTPAPPMTSGVTRSTWVLPGV